MPHRVICRRHTAEQTASYVGSSKPQVPYLACLLAIATLMDALHMGDLDGTCTEGLCVRVYTDASVMEDFPQQFEGTELDIAARSLLPEVEQLACRDLAPHAVEQLQQKLAEEVSIVGPMHCGKHVPKAQLAIAARLAAGRSVVTTFTLLSICTLTSKPS